MLLRIEPFGDYPTGNLTSDKATGLGNWSDDEIKRVITKGILKAGTRLLPFPMGFASYTVPPVSNKVPAPTRTFLPLFLWGKFKMLILGQDPPMVFLPGNAGVKGGL